MAAEAEDRDSARVGGGRRMSLIFFYGERKAPRDRVLWEAGKFLCFTLQLC